MVPLSKKKVVVALKMLKRMFYNLLLAIKPSIQQLIRPNIPLSFWTLLEFTDQMKIPVIQNILSSSP